MSKKLSLLGIVLASAAGIFIATYLWWQSLRSDITERTQATILYDNSIHEFADSRIKADSASRLTAILATAALSEALNVYPAGFLREFGPNIFVTGNLSIKDYPVAGTIEADKSRGWVVLASSYLFPSFDIQYAQRTFHHEFSSLLIRSHLFPDAQWQQYLPEDFSFPDSDEARLAATAQGLSATDIDELMADGFVADYGRSSLENDINTYAELLMQDPKRLRELAGVSEIVHRKAELIVQFYVSLHPGFNKIFRAAGLQNFLK